MSSSTHTDTPARARFPADPNCVICDGLGVRHTKAKRVGMHVRRDPCPCTILGPLQTTTERPLSELPPIKDTAVLDQYPDCQPRTPIDPVARILSPGLMRGNTDLLGSNWNPPTYRECTDCGGKGVLPRPAYQKLPGDPMCQTCKGAGKVRL